MTKNSISLSDIKDISKPLYSEYIEHGYKIKCSFETFTLYPITDLTIAIYSRGEYVKNVGEVDYIGKKFEPIDEGVNMCFDPLEIEKIIFKGIVILENNKMLILNKQDCTIQQIISLDKFLETLNRAYSAMDKSFDLDPCTSEAYYATMLGHRIINAKDKYPEILKILRSLEKELEEWLEKLNQKIKDRKTITLPELDKRDSKKAELELLKNILQD
jgi:hypothetical protein